MCTEMYSSTSPAFTPDNDGLNDALEITGRQIRLFEIWIYNRWGGLVYNSTDLDEAWIGDVNGGTHFGTQRRVPLDRQGLRFRHGCPRIPRVRPLNALNTFP